MMLSMPIEHGMAPSFWQYDRFLRQIHDKKGQNATERLAYLQTSCILIE
jgi:hypothetical protein